MSGGGGRTLNDDFDEDDLPGGALDLETGSQAGHGAAGASSYDGGGIDFDDELYGDGAQGAALELDMPGGGPAVSRPAPPPPAPSRAPAPPPGGGPAVPDLALDSLPSRAPAAPPAPPPSASGGSLAPRQSGAYPAAPDDRGSDPHHHPAPPGSDPAAARGSQSAQPPAPGPPPPPPPPPKPQPAAIIAKYPAPPLQILGAPRYTLRVLLRQFELRNELESLRRRRSPDVPLYEAALRAYDPKTFRLGMAINCAILALATFIFFLPVIIRFMRAD